MGISSGHLGGGSLDFNPRPRLNVNSLSAKVNNSSSFRFLNRNNPTTRRAVNLNTRHRNCLTSAHQPRCLCHGVIGRLAVEGLRMREHTLARQHSCLQTPKLPSQESRVRNHTREIAEQWLTHVVSQIEHENGLTTTNEILEAMEKIDRDQQILEETNTTITRSKIDGIFPPSSPHNRRLGRSSWAFMATIRLTRLLQAKLSIYKEAEVAVCIYGSDGKGRVEHKRARRKSSRKSKILQRKCWKGRKASEE